MPRDMVVGGPAYRAYVARLKSMDDGKIVLRAMTKQFRVAGKPILQAVKNSAQSLPSQNQNARRGRPSLRRTLAKAARLQISVRKDTVMRVKIDPKKMPAGMKGLPPYIEGKNTRLRHPTFGHEPYVTQAPSPFFWQAVEPHRDDAARAADKALNDIARELEK